MEASVLVLLVLAGYIKTLSPFSNIAWFDVSTLTGHTLVIARKWFLSLFWTSSGLFLLDSVEFIM